MAGNKTSSSPPSKERNLRRVTRKLKEKFLQDGRQRMTVATTIAEVKDEGAQASKFYARYMVRFKQWSKEQGHWKVVNFARSEKWAAVPGKGRNQRFNFERAMGETWEPKESKNAGVVKYDRIEETISLEEGESLMRMIGALGGMELDF